MRRVFCVTVLMMMLMHGTVSEAATYSTISWDIQNGNLVVVCTGLDEPFIFENVSGTAGFLIKGEFPSDTQINLPAGWALDIADGSMISVSDTSRLRSADEVPGLLSPAVRVIGSNTIILNAPGIYITAWHIRKDKPDYIAAHYQAWYREPRFSSQDSPGIYDNYEYNWTLRQHGNEDAIKFFSADKTANGQGENAGYQYPLTNFYDSRDGDLQKYHAASMKIAGINAVIFDFYGAVDVKDYKNPRVNSDAFIRNVLDPAGMNYMIFYEEFSAFEKDYNQSEDVTKEEARERIKTSFLWLKDNWFSRSGYVKHNGRPVVMLFVTNGVFSTLKEWEDIAVEAGVNPVPYFVCQYNSLSDFQAGFNWMPVDTSFIEPSQRKYYTGIEREELIAENFNWFSGITADHDFCIATAYPGFDDSVFDELDRFGENGSHNAINFDDGATFRQTFDLALSIKPNIIQLGTWNDYNEDTLIEPSASSLCHKKTETERGYSSLEYVQSRKREWEESEWTAHDLRAPLELFKLSKSPYVTSEQKERINEAYNAIFNNDTETFRSLAESLISYDSSVKPLLRAEILTASLSSGTQGSSYEEALNASGTAPVKWTAENLPEGITCSNSGTISGTPEVSGTFSVKITASNSAGSVSKTLQLIIADTQIPAVKITTSSSLSKGTKGAKYSKTLKATGAESFTWSVVSGTLPDGLKLGKTTGKIAGTPTKANTFKFTVRAEANGAYKDKSFSLTIAKALTISGTLPGSPKLQPYLMKLNVSGGVSPYTWTISKNSLPNGLMINSSTGIVYGIPARAGTYTFTVKVTDKNGAAKSKSYSVKITKPKINGTLGAGRVGKSYSKTLTASGGTEPYTWTISDGSLPVGLKLGRNTGKLSGTPKKAGKFTFTIQVTDANGAGNTQSYTVNIKPEQTASSVSGTETYSYALSFSEEENLYSRTELKVSSDDVLSQGEGRDEDIVIVRENQPVKFILGLWEYDISYECVYVDDEPYENITVSEGTFILPAEMIHDDFKVQVKSGCLESQELYISAE